MTLKNDTAGFNFGGPANYQIVVQGTLSEEWVARFGGMMITTSTQETGDPQTILRGPLQDQSALRGLFETLYALHLPILEVKKIDSPSINNTAKS